MPLTPQKQRWDTSFDASDFTLEDHSQYDFNASSPLLNIKSSPLKAMYDSPPRTPSYRLKTRERSFMSSPITHSPLAGPSAGNTEENDAVDALGEMLQDLKFKEHYLLVKEQTNKHTTKYHLTRTSSKGNTPVKSKKPSFGSTQSPSLEQSRAEKASAEVNEAQDRIVSSLEDRLNKRASAVAAKIVAIEEEKRRLEEERKRQEEERKRREEEERKRREEEERKRLEAEKKAKEEAEKKAAAEKKAKEEAEKKAKEEAEKKAKEEAEEAAKNGKGVTNFRDVEKQFIHYKEKIKEIKESIVLPVKSMDKAAKNAIFQHKRRINPKFGQLTSSRSQLAKISTEVVGMINETKALDIAYKWTLNFVAKAIVSQAETEVRVKPSSSLPLAKLTLYLMCEFPELKELLMARFVKKCPFVIGYTCSIDTEEGRLRMGWKRSDSKWEDESSYDERMGGMMTLYSVLTRLPMDQQHFEMPHPMPLAEGWKMVVRWLNLKPELLTNAHFIVAGAWWEASANEFLLSYGRQAKKLMQAVWTSWPASVEAKKFTGAKTLQTVGEDWSRDGSVKKFDDLEP